MKRPELKRPELKAPWAHARWAQGAIAVAALADVYRAVELRADATHRTDASLSASGTASMVFVYATTAAAVLFLLWLGRCRRNAEALAPGAVSASGVWTVVAWFIPVVNWWVPRRFVLEVERVSADVSGRPRKEALVNAWWTVWVAHSAVSVVAFSVGKGVAVPVLVVAEGLSLGAAVLVIGVVQHLTGLQDRQP
ncbi:DUF4328 domain-containing protein [Streptomyces sp. NPDC051576]|uniref:DUF4328 domain-containing protein n=1 Tax=Streptomyces sp. NPDC051576 TaxID=3155803 RepID=UPI0034461962